MQEMKRDPSLSLREKFSQHWDYKRKKTAIPHVEILNRWAPIIFFFIFLGASAWGLLVVLPYHYGGGITMVILEIFTIYVFCQILINWFLLKYTDSTYDPALHGTENRRPRTHREASEDRWYAIDPSHVMEDSGSHTEELSDPTGIQENGSQITHKKLDGHSYQVYVPISVTDTSIERKAFSYWSWKPCVACQRPRPPRCHHCSLCKRCVLKRDHHCFFVRACVGFNNQRYFIYFLLWCVVMTLWGTYQITPYVFREILPKYSYADFVFPINLFRCLFGYLPPLYLHLTFVNLGTIGLLFVSSAMLCGNIYFVLIAKTSFEDEEKIKLIDTRDFAGRLRAVFGEMWGLSVFIPGYAKSKPIEDAVYWPYIKAS